MWDRHQKEKGFLERRYRQLPADTEQVGDVTGQPGIAALDRTPLGEIANDYSVRSVYDTRPVNAIDFHFALSAVITVPEEATSNVAMSTVVPEGYVAVVRAIELWFAPSMSFTREEVYLVPTVNGAAVPHNRYYCGNGTDAPIKVFYIADESAEIGVRVYTLENFTVDPLTIWVQLHGNLLLKSGRPKGFEIANAAAPELQKTSAPSLREPAPKAAALSAFVPKDICDAYKNFDKLSADQKGHYQNQYAAMSPGDKLKFSRKCMGAGVRARSST